MRVMFYQEFKKKLVKSYKKYSRILQVHTTFMQFIWYLLLITCSFWHIAVEFLQFKYFLTYSHCIFGERIDIKNYQEAKPNACIQNAFFC